MKTSIYRLMVFVLGLSFCSFGIGKGIFKIDTLVKISYNSPNDTVLSNNNNPLYVGPSLFRCDDDTVIFVYEGYNNTLIKLNVRQGIVWKKKLPNNIAPLDFTIFESDICMFFLPQEYRSLIDHIAYSHKYLLLHSPSTC